MVALQNDDCQSVEVLVVAGGGGGGESAFSSYISWSNLNTGRRHSSFSFFFYLSKAGLVDGFDGRYLRRLA